MEEVREWQNRRLEQLYPVVFFDALRIKIRDEGTVKNKVVYLVALGVPDGTKDILGSGSSRARERSSGSE